MHWHRLPRGHCAQNTLWALRWQWAQSGGVGDLGGLFQTLGFCDSMTARER